MGFNEFSSNFARLQVEAGDTLHSPRRYEKRQKSCSDGNGGDWQNRDGGTHSGANPFAAVTARDHGLPNHDRDQTSISELGPSSDEQTSSGHGYSNLDTWWQDKGCLDEQIEQGAHEYHSQFTRQRRSHDATGTNSSVENTPAINSDVNNTELQVIHDLVYSDRQRLTTGDVKEAINLFNLQNLEDCKKYAISKYNAIVNSNNIYKQRFNTIITCINQRLDKIS